MTRCSAGLASAADMMTLRSLLPLPDPLPLLLPQALRPPPRPLSLPHLLSPLLLLLLLPTKPSLLPLARVTPRTPVQPRPR